MSITLREMKVGDEGRIKAIRVSDSAFRERLLSMGLTRGAHFTVKRVAPLGDPVEIRVRGFALSLRKADADGVKIEKVLR
jgi:ferrous iron transport protein A